MIEFDFWDRATERPDTFGLSFSFDTRTAEELDEAVSMLEAARALAPQGTRVAYEIEAATAYARTLAACLRVPLASEEPKP